MMKLQPAVKTETIKVAKAEAVGVLLMFAVFFVLHLLFPNAVPFDYKVILAGIIGGCVAVANFLLMGISIQKMTDAGDVDTGKAIFKSGYRKRMLLQILWGIAALVAPCFNGIAGIIPLLIPTFAIRMTGIKQALFPGKNITTAESSNADEAGKGDE